MKDDDKIGFGEELFIFTGGMVKVMYQHPVISTALIALLSLTVYSMTREIKSTDNKMLRRGYKVVQEDLDGDGELEKTIMKDCQKYILRDYKKGDYRIYNFRIIDGRSGKKEIILTEEYKLSD